MVALVELPPLPRSVIENQTVHYVVSIVQVAGHAKNYLYAVISILKGSRFFPRYRFSVVQQIDQFPKHRTCQYRFLKYSNRGNSNFCSLSCSIELFNSSIFDVSINHRHFVTACSSRTFYDFFFSSLILAERSSIAVDANKIDT